MKTIYSTREWKGYGKQNYFHNEYRQEGNIISKVKCNRRKFFDGKENNWETTERIVETWTKGNSNIPDWLNKLIK